MAIAMAHSCTTPMWHYTRLKKAGEMALAFMGRGAAANGVEPRLAVFRAVRLCPSSPYSFSAGRETSGSGPASLILTGTPKRTPSKDFWRAHRLRIFDGHSVFHRKVSLDKSCPRGGNRYAKPVRRRLKSCPREKSCSQSGNRYAKPVRGR